MSKMKKGAVMMEYAMVCVLVAAASAVAFWYFGRSVQNSMTVASLAVSTAEQAAADTAQSNRKAQSLVYSAALLSAKSYIAASIENLLDGKVNKGYLAN